MCMCKPNFHNNYYDIDGLHIQCCFQRDDDIIVKNCPHVLDCIELQVTYIITVYTNGIYINIYIYI